MDIGILLRTTLHPRNTADSDRHVLPLFALAVSLNAKRILELGVRYGDSTLPLLMAAKLTQGQLWSVDIAQTAFKPDEDLSPYWSFIQSDAISFLEQTVEHGVGSFDLVFVDDWHGYRHVKRELELLDQLVTPRSIILLHDLMYGGTPPNYHSDVFESNPEFSEGGPYRAVNELDKNKWEWSTIPVDHGLTILRKKA